MSAEKIFREVLKEIQSGNPGFLVREHLDQEDFELILKGLRHHPNYLERYSFR